MSDLGQHCLPMLHKKDARVTWVKYLDCLLVIIHKTGVHEGFRSQNFKQIQRGGTDGPDTPKNHKATQTAFNLGRYQTCLKLNFT